jgi:hypothetical protein
MYAVAQGYSRLSLSLINDYEQIFTDELTKGAASLNREFRTLGVVVPVSEEGKFIDGYYAYLQAQVAQPFVPPTPPTPPTPPQPKREPVKPKPVPPPSKPEPVKPKPATKVDKLSKKYEDIDLDF